MEDLRFVDATTLKRMKLTLSDFYAMIECLKELASQNQTNTFIKSVAEYFERNGYKVTENGFGSYVIRK